MTDNERLAALISYANTVLRIMAGKGPDAHDRLGEIVMTAVDLGLGKMNKRATEDTDPWLILEQ